MIINLYSTSQKRASNLIISGNFTNSQFQGDLIDTSGLTFTVNFNDGTSQVIYPDFSNKYWATGVAEQVIEVNYILDGKTVTGKKSVRTYEHLVLTQVNITNPNNKAVFYNIPAGTSVYLDNLGSQLITPNTVVTGNSVWVTGNSPIQYLYYKGNDTISNFNIYTYGLTTHNEVELIDLMTTDRYNDGTLGRCVNGYPVLTAIFNGDDY